MAENTDNYASGDNSNSDTNNPNGAIISRDAIDQVAGWVSATLVSAFFSSLERFSCVVVSTANVDDDSDDEDGASDRPPPSSAPTAASAADAGGQSDVAKSSV
ncbi:Trehalase [Psidium guajava]|nr:Trehalase [Psidium guajava]